jgi:hypothetical protein
MTEEKELRPGAAAATEEVPPGEWPEWCRQASQRQHGRVLVLYFADDALGEVRLAEGQPFVAIEHDQLGKSVALTLKYGDGVVPMRYVIANPRQVLLEKDDEGQVRQVTIVDITGRRTFISLV